MGKQQHLEFNIQDADLAAALELSIQKLNQIVQFCESQPQGKSALREGEHFIYTNHQLKKRLFCEQGAYALGAYLDSQSHKSVWQQLLELINPNQDKIRNALISQKILENCSSLTVHRNRYFLSKKDVIGILCTSPARLEQAFRDIQKSHDPLVIYEDFEDIEGIRYYSLSGFYKLSQRLGNDLKDKERRNWCAAIELVGRKTFKLIVDAQTAERQRTQSVAVKRRSKQWL